MVDCFSDLAFLHLIIITSQEETLSGNSVFEIFYATFILKIKIYHADNGIFSEEPFLLAIEDDNHTITLCGVVSHHKIFIVERKIQTLTLEDI